MSAKTPNDRGAGDPDARSRGDRGRGLLTIRGLYVDGRIVLLDAVPIQGRRDVLITFLEGDDFVMVQQDDYESMNEAASLEAASKARNLLTNREYDVLELLRCGLTNKEIAIELRLSTGTVRNYASSIYNKLEVRNRIEAVTRAVELGLID